MRILAIIICFLLVFSGCVSPTTPPTTSTPTATITNLPATPTPFPPSPTATFTTTPTLTVTSSPTSTPTQEPSPTLSPTPEPVLLIGAGDIASCGEDGDEITAELLDRYPTAHIFTAGDNAYNSGSPIEFQNCFHPSWGRHKERISPSLGNHEYNTPGAAGYFEYFGAAAGDPALGYYSYDLGDWHVVVLNTNCGDVGCGIESPQEQWLRADLANSSAKCSIAYMHLPRWSSGPAGSSGWISGLWRALFEYGVEIGVSGHDHSYERFAPQDGDGNPDPNGIRQFVVGTGGAYQRAFGEAQPNSEVRSTGVFGVILFTLNSDSYSWEFIPAEGETFTDSGSDICH